MTRDGHVIWRGQIDGEFTGFDSDAIFKLSDGTYWLQDEYCYWYYYAYQPEVEIISERGTPHLRVVGQTQSVAVRQVLDVIESQINGAFNGWAGDSEYELTNGQVWKQKRYRYEYNYKYRPQAIIYSASGGEIMDVDGCRAIVERIR
jgi:hypothetical protein